MQLIPEKLKPYVSVNNIKSSFKEVISGVPQESIVGPIQYQFQPL